MLIFPVFLPSMHALRYRTCPNKLILYINYVQYQRGCAVLANHPRGGGGTSLCQVYGYVPPTRVNFSLPKIQNRPQILKFYSRTGPTFWSFTPEPDSFLTIWSQTPGSNVKIPVAFSFCFLQPDVFTFVLLYLSKCFKLSITGISLSQDICIPLWI